MDTNAASYFNEQTAAQYTNTPLGKDSEVPSYHNKDKAKSYSLGSVGDLGKDSQVPIYHKHVGINAESSFTK